MLLKNTKNMSKCAFFFLTNVDYLYVNYRKKMTFLAYCGYGFDSKRLHIWTV